jgi:phospholipase A1
MKKLSLFLFCLFTSATVNAKFDVEKIKNRYESMLDQDYTLIGHNGSYLLPLSYNGSPNEDPYHEFASQAEFEDRGDYNRNLEAEFQFSFIVLGSQSVFDSDWDFFVGYTQRSWWQLYNGDWSRPFRESNYAPEVFIRKHFLGKEISFLGSQIPLIDFGYIHQSNGQLQELSRSWDRIFFRTILDFDAFILKTMLWYRLPEQRKDDDNYDIQKYLGYGAFEFIKAFSQDQVSLKIIPGTERVGYELDYSTPWKKGFRWYTKISTGTGLSLIDYNKEGHKIGVGVILTDFITSIQ